MNILIIVLVVVLLVLGLAVKIVKQYEQGVLFRLGRVLGLRQPGLRLIIPFVDVLHRVSLRIITLPIQSQGIITRDNVSVDVSAVAYYLSLIHISEPTRLGMISYAVFCLKKKKKKKTKTQDN